MIKRLILAVLIALPVSLMAQKFGVVDVEAIITKMPEYTAMQKQIEEASAKYQTEFDKLNEEINKKFTELQELDKDAATPSSIKERRLQEVQELDQKMQQFRNTVNQDLQRQQAQLMAPIEQKFQDAVKTVGNEGNFVFIFQKGMSLYEGAMVEDCTKAVSAKLGL